MPSSRPPQAHIYHYNQGQATQEDSSIWYFFYSPCANRKSIPLQTLADPYGTKKLKLPESLNNWHMRLARLSALRTSLLYPQETHLVLISISVWMTPGHTLCKWRVCKFIQTINAFSQPPFTIIFPSLSKLCVATNWMVQGLKELELPMLFRILWFYK
jgi:hypothetical protein